MSRAMVSNVANRFIEILSKDLGEDVMAEIRSKAKSPTYAMCCGSHDYCDANMVMLEAFKDCVGREAAIFSEDAEKPDSTHEQDTGLINQSWALAIENNYRVVLLTPCCGAYATYYDDIRCCKVCYNEVAEDVG